MIDFMAQHCFGEYCLSLWGASIIVAVIGSICVAIGYIGLKSRGEIK